MLYTTKEKKIIYKERLNYRGNLVFFSNPKNGVYKKKN